MPKTKERSVTLDPRSVPRPNSGTPFKADTTETVDSGKTDITDIIKKLTINSETLKSLAIFEEEFTAYSALFTSTKSDTKNNTRFNNSMHIPDLN